MYHNLKCTIQWNQKLKRRGPARDRTGIVGIRIQSDNHYTTEPANDETVLNYASSRSTASISYTTSSSRTPHETDLNQ